ncbi:nucleoside deaminase [Candidatus Auribacterota bacterium]
MSPEFLFNDEKFMLLAIEKAREGIQKGQAPFGACIVRDGELVSCVHNIVWESTDITAHAEVHCIREACGKLKTIDLSGCALYATCEPCPMCFTAAHWARISRIVYGACINDAKKAGFNELTIEDQEMNELGNSYINVTGDFMKDECLALFKEWKESKKSKPY